MKYIIHLDGLRALAILTVVLFHYFPEIVPGGFIGVDWSCPEKVDTSMKRVRS